MSAFNSFTYVNSDTLSKLAELQNNISDTQGRPTFSVFGFAPVYDYRLDSTGDSPFTYKFGDKDVFSGNISKFPASNMSTQPFSTLVNKLDGILFEDDYYFWRPPGSSSAVTERTYGQDNKYRIVKTSKDYSGVENASHFIVAIGYWECVSVTDIAYKNKIGTIRFEKNLIGGTDGSGNDILRDDHGEWSDTAVDPITGLPGAWINTVNGGPGLISNGTVIVNEPVETLWIYRTTDKDTTGNGSNSTLNNVMVRDDFGVIVYNDKIVVPRSNAWVWQLSTQVTNASIDATQKTQQFLLSLLFLNYKIL